MVAFILIVFTVDHGGISTQKTNNIHDLLRESDWFKVFRLFMHNSISYCLEIAST